MHLPRTFSTTDLDTWNVRVFDESDRLSCRDSDGGADQAIAPRCEWRENSLSVIDIQKARLRDVRCASTIPAEPILRRSPTSTFAEPEPPSCAAVICIFQFPLRNTEGDAVDVRLREAHKRGRQRGLPPSLPLTFPFHARVRVSSSVCTRGSPAEKIPVVMDNHYHAGISQAWMRNTGAEDPSFRDPVRVHETATRARARTHTHVYTYFFVTMCKKRVCTVSRKRFSRPVAAILPASLL